MIAKYENGAVHNDHHKELNIQAGILTEESLAKLITGFMQEETDFDFGKKETDFDFRKKETDFGKDETSEAAEPTQDVEVIDECTSCSSASTSCSSANSSCSSYPPITQTQERFFEKWRWVIIDEKTGKIRENVSGNLAKTEKKMKVDVKLEQLMHRIYDHTHEHDWNPDATSSVHRWRMLYDLLARLKFFKEGERKKYRAYVDAVVRYCYPEVKDTYNDNLRQSTPPESFHDWDEEDKEEYRRLKDIIQNL